MVLAYRRAFDLLWPFALRLMRFGAVGGLAFAVHWLTVVVIVSHLSIQPLVANIFGFLAAFQVSYVGHRYWTFGADAGTENSLPRFFLVAIAGFFINEGIYAVLLKHTALGYKGALVIAVAGAAAGTYVLSHFWAFRPSRDMRQPS